MKQDERFSMQDNMIVEWKESSTHIELIVDGVTYRIPLEKVWETMLKIESEVTKDTTIIQFKILVYKRLYSWAAARKLEIMERSYWFVVDNQWAKAKKRDTGWGNGYVVVPPDHPFHGKYSCYINERISIHGGVSFSYPAKECLGKWSNNKEYIGEDQHDMWVIGFDTHREKSSPEQTEEWVRNETKRLYDILMDIGGGEYIMAETGYD